MIKNTPEYLQKLFVEHHLKMGISHIYFVVDEGSVAVEFIKNPNVEYISIEKALNERDKWESKITIEQFRKSKQIMMYNWFLETYRNQYDWIAFIDDDEFLELDLHFLSNFSNYSAFYLPWRLLVNYRLNQQENLDGFEVVNNTYIKNFLGSAICKSIVNTKICDHIENDHFADYKGIFQINIGYEQLFANYCNKTLKNEDFQDIISKGEYYINHYYIRSYEEYVSQVYDRGDNWTNYLDYLGISIPNRNMCDYYACMYNDYCRVEILINDLKTINRNDIVQKIFDDPIYYAVGCKITREFLDLCDIEKLKQKYGEKQLKAYLEKYLI